MFLRRRTCYPAAADAVLAWADYLALKKRRLLAEVQAHQETTADFFRFRSIEPAVHDIRRRHGPERVLSFMTTAWKEGSILGIDDFFLPAFNEFRYKAFDIDWDDCSGELAAAQYQVERDGESLTEPAREPAH